MKSDLVDSQHRNNLSELLTAALEDMKALLVTLNSIFWATLQRDLLTHSIICIKPSRRRSAAEEEGGPPKYVFKIFLRE